MPCIFIPSNELKPGGRRCAIRGLRCQKNYTLDYLYTVPVKQTISYNSGMFFITITCIIILVLVNGS